MPSGSGPAPLRERRALPVCVAGRYTLDVSLGSGGMGEVFSARDERTGERVALKIVRRSDAAPQGVERLLREAVAASRAAHPAVVNVVEASEDAPNDLAFIAQELLGMVQTVGFLGALAVAFLGAVGVRFVLRAMAD